MRVTRTLFIQVAVIAVSIASQCAGTQADSAKPVAPLTWLVGGVWTADGSKIGGNVLRAETRYEWSDNKAYLRFNTHFVTDKNTLYIWDGSFFWDSEKGALAMWCINGHNEVMEGPLLIDGEVVSVHFRAKNSSEKLTEFRASWRRESDDQYGFLLEERQGKGWKALQALEYKRVDKQTS